jgi:hypothetical protein
MRICLFGTERGVIESYYLRQIFGDSSQISRFAAQEQSDR